MTYTKCSLCGGNGVIPKRVRLARFAEPERQCPCVRSGTPGWDATGVTLGQLERAIAAEEELRELKASMTTLHQP